MVHDNEDYLRMLILLLPFMDCRFFHHYEYSYQHLETEILLSIEYHSHIQNLDRTKNMIRFYYDKKSYEIDDFIEILKKISLSLLTYHNNQLVVDNFEDEDDFIQFYQNKILSYFELNKLISDSLLMAIYNYYHDYDVDFCIHNHLLKPISVVNYQLDTLLNQGLAETHTHIVGSIPFEKQWNWLLREVINLNPHVKTLLENTESDLSVQFQKRRYGFSGSLKNLVQSIAILRLLMILFLIYHHQNKHCALHEYLDQFIQNIDLSIKSYFEIFLNYFRKGDSLSALTYDDFNQMIRKIRMILSLDDLQESDFSLYVYEKFMEEFFENYDTNPFQKNLEYIFQYQSIAYMDENNDEEYKKLFIHYIRVKNFIHSFICFSTDIKGFLEFQFFFKRQHSFFDVASNMFQNIFDAYAYDKVKYLEIRIGHVKFKQNKNEQYPLKNRQDVLLQFCQSLYSFAEVYQNYLRNHSQLVYAGLVLHFNKRYDDEMKCWDNYFTVKDDSYLRYKLYQEECFLNLAVFQYIRGKIPYAENYLVGIDAASNELLTEPWVLAPVFRVVKDKYKDTLVQKAKKYGLVLKRTKNVGVTYHVGEVFDSLASGFRHVDEVLDYYGFQNGERLGHGTILGISIDDYMSSHKIVSLPAIELLDNWLWIYHLKSHKNLFKDISIGYIEEQIWKLVHFIYDDNGHLPAHISIHHLYRAYQKQFEGLDFANNKSHQCLYHMLKDDCHFRSHSEWDENLLLYSRHCRCFLEKMVRVVQFHTDNDVLKMIYKEVQNYLCQKIARKGIVVEINPVSSAIIGDFHSIYEHPIFYMNDSISRDHHHIMVSINTDDPGVFGTTLRNQFGFIEQMLLSKGFPMEKTMNWIDMTRKNGMNSTFINKTYKSREEIINELEEIKKAIKGVSPLMKK